MTDPADQPLAPVETAPPETAETAAFGKKELTEIFDALTTEVNRRFKNKNYLARLDTNDLLNHIEKIVALNKRSPTIAPMVINNNLGIIQAKVKELDSHPSRRKELRVQVRKINNIPR